MGLTAKQQGVKRTWTQNGEGHDKLNFNYSPEAKAETSKVHADFLKAKAALESVTASEVKDVSVLNEYRKTKKWLTNRYSKLVHKQAHLLKARCSESYEDLLSEGYIGLFKALDRFDISRGIAFTSFAVPYIRGQILRHLRDNSLVKVPRSWHELYSKIKNKNNSELSEFAIATSISMSEILAAKNACETRNGYREIQDFIELPLPHSCKPNPSHEPDNIACAELLFAQIKQKHTTLTETEKSAIAQNFFALGKVARKKKMSALSRSNLESAISKLSNCAL